MNLDGARQNPVAMKESFENEVIPFLSPNAWVRSARACGFTINPLLLPAGFMVEAGGLPRIARFGLVQLMESCVSKGAPDHYFPLVLGGYFVFDYMPSFETFLATLPALRDAGPLLSWMPRLLSGCQLDVREHANELRIKLHVDRYPEAYTRQRQYFVEAFLTGVVRCLTWILPRNVKPQRVDVPHELGSKLVLFEKSYGCPVYDKSTRCVIVLSKSLLDLPLTAGAPDIHQQARSRVEDQLPVAYPADVIEQAQRLLFANPELTAQGVLRVSEQLGLQPRTLQRRLQGNGITYTDLCQKVRCDIAVSRLMEDKVDIGEVSRQLGFSSRHSFTRAFKRWCGVTPKAFRERNKNAGKAIR